MGVCKLCRIQSSNFLNIFSDEGKCLDMNTILLTHFPFEVIFFFVLTEFDKNMFPV